MRDPRSRWNTLVVLLALFTMLGSSALQGKPRFHPDNDDSLVVRDSTVTFGSVALGSSQTVTDYIFNPTSAAVTITAATATSRDFKVTAPSLPVTIASHAGTRLTLSFTPSVAGSRTATLAITSTAPQPSLEVSLSGSGTGTATGGGSGTAEIAVNPTSITFGSVQMGSRQVKSATLTNSGTTSMTISQASATTGDFAVHGLSLPLTLQPQQSTSFVVVFTPQSSGNRTGTISLTGSAGTGSHQRGSETASLRVSGIGAASSGGGSGPTAGTLSVSPVTFGTVPVGTTQKQMATVTNSGGSSVTLNQATVTGTGFSMSPMGMPMTLAAGASTSISISCSPKSAGALSGTLAVSSNASNGTAAAPLSATATATTATGGSLTAGAVSFGSEQVGSTTTLPATLTNSGTTTVTVSAANLAGTAFTTSGLTTSLPLTLNAGQSFTFNVLFNPKASGTASGSIAVVSTASTSPTISLSGSGAAAGQLAVSPASAAFGNVTVGQSKSLPITVSATGSSLTVTSASTGSAEFTLTGPSLPATIPAGGTASFTLMFTPQASGGASSSASFITSASSTPITESLTGTGTAATPVQHSVALNWSPSNSSVTGYNVYRGGTTGGPYSKITGSEDASTSYDDSSVQGGQTYFYVTTAVGTDGMESAYSNEVKAVIPTP